MKIYFYKEKDSENVSKEYFNLDKCSEDAMKIAKEKKIDVLLIGMNNVKGYTIGTFKYNANTGKVKYKEA